LKVATIGSVPVYIGRSWGILAVIILVLLGPQLQEANPDLGFRAYLIAAAYALMLLVAVFVHEGAHALGARSFGYPVHRVVADLWGGHTALDVSRATPGPSAVVAVVGPLSNLVLAALGQGVAALVEPGIPHGLASIFALLNFLLALFNLLPGLPLDGGQLVEALVWKVTGNRHRGRVVAGYAGLVVTLGVLFWFVGRPLLAGEKPSFGSIGWSLLICMFLWQGAQNAIRSGKVAGIIAGVRVVDLLQPVVPVPAGASLADLPSGLPPVVVDTSGMPIGLVDADALAAVPGAAIGQTPVLSVTRPMPPDWVVDVDPNGPITPVLAPLSRQPAGLVAIRWGGRVLGVVSVAAVNAAASARAPRP
jgi:Zn-dependent protease